MAELHVTKENFKEEVLNAKEPVLVDFWAAWCGPCQMLMPTIEKLSKELTDVKICKVNVDEQQELAGEYGVMSIPTLIVFRDGTVAEKSVGVKSEAEIKKMLGK